MFNIVLFDKYYYSFKNNCLLNINDNSVVNDDKTIGMYKSFVMLNHSNLFINYKNNDFNYNYIKDEDVLIIKNYGKFKFCYNNNSVIVKKISDNDNNIDSIVYFDNDNIDKLIIMKFYVNMLYNWIISNNGVFVIDTNLIPIIKYHFYNKIYYYDTAFDSLNYVYQNDIFNQKLSTENLQKSTDIVYYDVEKRFKDYVLDNFEEKDNLPKYEFNGNKIILYVDKKIFCVYEIVYDLKSYTRFIKRYLNDNLSEYFNYLTKINYIYVNEMIYWSNDFALEVYIDDINIDLLN